MGYPRPFSVELDIRPLIEVGHAPYQKIMETIDALPAGADFRLIAPFKPTPLYLLMTGKGFDHSAKQRPDDPWVIDFTRKRLS